MANFNNDPPVFDKSYLKPSESGVVRLIRTTCKALARGADEKCGKFKGFKTYVRDFLKGHKLQAYHWKNFMGIASIFYLKVLLEYFVLREKIEEFLTGNQTNKLLMAVLHDIKIPIFLAEVKALGLVSRLITGPLWCLLEDRSVHIMDMNTHYLELVVFFDDALQDIGKFMKGNLLPFGDATLVKQDPLLECLLEDWEHDDKVVVFLNITLPGSKEAFC